MNAERNANPNEPTLVALRNAIGSSAIRAPDRSPIADRMPIARAFILSIASEECPDCTSDFTYTLDFTYRGGTVNRGENARGTALTVTRHSMFSAGPLAARALAEPMKRKHSTLASRFRPVSWFKVCNRVGPRAAQGAVASVHAHDSQVTLSAVQVGLLGLVLE